MNTPRKKNKNELKKYLVPALIVALGILAFLGASPYLVKCWAGAGDIDKFASTFELASALFSGLAFVAVTVTLVMQGEELRLQRKELRQTRKVMIDQQEELKRNADAMSRQTFEATFFRMAQLLNDVRDQIPYPMSGHVAGRAAFEEWADQMKIHIPVVADLTKIKSNYERFYDSLAAEKLGHYFRILYVTLKFVRDSPVNDKRTYSRIIRAQMSNNELLVVFYNALSKYGQDRMLPLVEQFDLFDNMPSTLLRDPAHRDLINSTYADRQTKKVAGQPAGGTS